MPRVQGGSEAERNRTAHRRCQLRAVARKRGIFSLSTPFQSSRAAEDDYDDMEFRESDDAGGGEADTFAAAAEAESKVGAAASRGPPPSAPPFGDRVEDGVAGDEGGGSVASATTDAGHTSHMSISRMVRLR